jgi:hypothetical protein
MLLRRFGFIVKAAGYDSREHRSILDSGQFKTVVVGVASCEAARDVVREMVADGIQLIELCGGFTRDDRAALEQCIEFAVPIGVVTYSAEEEARLGDLFSPS